MLLKAKKSMLILVFLVVLSVSCLADDVSIAFDGEPAWKYLDIYPGRNIVSSFTLSPGVRIVDVELTCDIEAFCAILKEQIGGLDETRHEKTHTIERTLYIHEKMPAGDYEVDMKIYYQDEKGKQKTKSHHLDVEVKPDSLFSVLYGNVVQMTSDDVVYMVMEDYLPKKLEWIPKEITPADLNIMDFSSIDLTKKDIDDGNFVMEEVAFKVSQKQTLTEEELVDSLKNGNSDVALFSRKVINSDIPVVEKSFNVYRFINPDNSRSILFSKILVSVHGGMHDVEVVEVIPKKTAGSAKDVIFTDYPVVLDDDPIVKWNIPNLPKGKVKDYSYIVEGQVNSLGTTVAIGEKHSLFSRFVMFWLHGGWILISFIFLIVVSWLLIYRRKHKV